MPALDKAPDAFRIISEVADDLDVPQHVLRFWESRFQQIKPMKRGGGRRYYRPDDVDLLRGVHHLLYSQGYTIRGVQRILREQGVRFVQSVWQEGAPQPPRGLAGEGGADATAAGRGRGLLGLLPGFRSADNKTEAGAENEDEAIVAQSAAKADAPVRKAAAPDQRAASAGLTREQRQALEATLEQLDECRRLLAAAAE
jgi:DNA-binding transcriptional MerR regulator